jgi:hypothetical protein
MDGEPDFLDPEEHDRRLRGIPDDARRLGLDHNTLEGAMLAFSGSLDRTKPSHRITAWVLLLIFGLPVVLTVLRLGGDLYRALVNP